MLVTDGTKYYFCVVDGKFYNFYSPTTPISLTIKNESGTTLANTTVYINGIARTSNASGVISFSIDSSNSALTLSKLSNSEKTYAILNPQNASCTATVICNSTVTLNVAGYTRGTVSFSDGTSMSLDRFKTTASSTSVQKPIGTTFTVTAGYNYDNNGNIQINGATQSSATSASGTLLASTCTVAITAGYNNYSDYANSCGCGGES